MADAIPFPITPKSGVMKSESSRVAEGRFTDMDKIRFVLGTDGMARAEKVGGNVRVSSVPSNGNIRTLHAWRDNTAIQYAAAGTSKKLYVYDTSWVQNDITPFRATGTLGNNPFTTVNGSPLVTVAHTAHGAAQGDTVIYSGATAVGGLTPNGTFTVTSVTSANAYVITLGSNATSGATGGGAAVAFSYEISIGVDLATFGFGAGVGPYGAGTWGTPRSSSTLSLEPRVWSLDHFGQLLIASYQGGAIYNFDPTQTQPWPRAALYSTSPTDCRFVWVTSERFVVALRAGMVLHWCSQGDPTTWTPATSNTANTRTLTEGTKLVAGRVLGPLLSLIWSDAAVFQMQYTGDAFIHTTRMIGKDCGLLSPSAVITADGVAYWMGTDTFWMCDGNTVQQMPGVMAIRDFVFRQLTNVQGYQCFAYYNPTKHEVWFGYTVSGGTNVSLYLIYNIADQSWAVGTWTRMAGAHFTQGDTRPYLADADGYIYQHENGYDDNGSPLAWKLTLAPFAIFEGKENYQVQGFLLDTFAQIGNINLAVTAYDRLTDAVAEDTETDVVTPTSGLTDTRISGRYIGFNINSSDLGGYFKMGKPAAFVQKIGVRR